MGLSACNNHRAYLLCVHLSVHCALRHVVMCVSEGTHIRFLYYMWLLQIDVLLEQEKTVLPRLHREPKLCNLESYSLFYKQDPMWPTDALKYSPVCCKISIMFWYV